MTNVHEFKWDDSSVQRFWDYYATQNKISYFAQSVGKEVYRLASKHVHFKGNILDYGCGKGHLVQELLKAGLKDIYGADFSHDSVEHVNKQFTSNAGFKGAVELTKLPAPELKPDFFDSVFLLETIEHLIPPYLENTFTELSRIIKPGGYVIITTPSNEDLEMQKVLCPNCGAHFHRVQHVNSFSEKSIAELLEKHGFKKKYCESVHLEGYFTMRKRFARFVKSILGTKTGVNLIYIGQKI